MSCGINLMNIGTFSLIIGACTVAYMSLWYAFARYVKRVDVVDSAWGLGFVYIAAIAYYLQPDTSWVKLLSLVLVAIWGFRLFGHLSLRNSKRAEDPRYEVFKEKWGSSFWLKTYFNIYLLQGVLIALISIPIFAIMRTVEPQANPITILGFGLWIFGIIFESIADYQLQQFVRTKKKGQIMQSGLWKYSRHPNYFGEVCVWWGAALVALSLDKWVGLVGAILITVLITKVSGLPPLEKRYSTNKAYQAYKKRTSALVPLPAKR